MDTQTFWQEIGKISSEFDISNHPLVNAIHAGTAPTDHIKQFAVEHYEMTVRDSGGYMAQGYISMRNIDKEGAGLMAENFAEEAMGLYTQTTSHTELLFEFWEQALGLSRAELEESSATPAARAMNAYFWIMMTHKARYAGAIGMLEGGFSQACEKMLDGFQKHYDMKPGQLRFFSGHIEADREHAAVGKTMIERLMISDRDRHEFLKEAGCVAELYWKGWDAMLQ